MIAADLASALGGKRSGAGFIATCPSHDDRTPSLSISEKGGKLLVCCHAGCDQARVLAALADRGLEIREQHERAHTSIAEFAQAKRLDPTFLKSHGVRDIALDGGISAIAFDYRNRAGIPVGTKIRRALNGCERAFHWERGSKPCLYGAWRVPELHMLDQRLLIVEGESDTLTLWAHDFAAVGLPGANSWREEWADDLRMSPAIFVVIEPDAGGQAVLAWLAKSGIRERCRLIRMTKEAKDPSALYLSDPSKFSANMDALIKASTPLAVGESQIQLRHVADIVAERREPSWLLHQTLERGVLAVLAGPRSSFKSFIALSWIMRAAVAGHPAVILSGEGGGLDRRIDAWMRANSPGSDLRSLPIVALERPVNLGSTTVLVDLCEAIRAARIEPHFVVVDTFSKFAPGLDENENGAVNLFLSGLASGVRDAFNCTVLLVAHTGHGDRGRPRGASVLMCNPDAEYIVERPDPTALACTVTRERFKDYASLPALAYTGEVIDLGRVDSYGESVTSLVMRDCGVAPPVRHELRGKAQRQLLAALRARQEPSRIWTLADLRETGRLAGQHRNTAAAAAEALAMSPFMATTIGGWRLADQ